MTLYSLISRQRLFFISLQKTAVCYFSPLLNFCPGNGCFYVSQDNVCFFIFRQTSVLLNSISDKCSVLFLPQISNIVISPRTMDFFISPQSTADFCLLSEDGCFLFPYRLLLISVQRLLRQAQFLLFHRQQLFLFFPIQWWYFLLPIYRMFSNLLL